MSEFVTKKEAMRLLELGRKGFDKLVKEGTIPLIVNKVPRVPLEQLLGHELYPQKLLEQGAESPQVEERELTETEKSIAEVDRELELKRKLAEDVDLDIELVEKQDKLSGLHSRRANAEVVIEDGQNRTAQKEAVVDQLMANTNKAMEQAAVIKDKQDQTDERQIAIDKQQAAIAKGQKEKERAIQDDRDHLKYDQEQHAKSLAIQFQARRAANAPAEEKLEKKRKKEQAKLPKPPLTPKQEVARNLEEWYKKGDVTYPLLGKTGSIIVALLVFTAMCYVLSEIAVMISKAAGVTI